MKKFFLNSILFLLFIPLFLFPNNIIQHSNDVFFKTTTLVHKTAPTFLTYDKNIPIYNTKLLSTTSFSSYSANIPHKKVAYLTFDDGPSKNTLKILTILDKYKIKATFFVNGSSSPYAISTYKTIINKGHSIGNHTYSHEYCNIYKSTNDFVHDFNKLQNHLNKCIGIKPNIVRLPGGSNNLVSHKYGGKSIMCDISRYLIKNGFTYFDWNIDSTDASTKVQSKEKIVNSILNTSKRKSAIIVLMHDSSVKKTTVEALPEVIDGLKKQGFEFRKLSPNEYITQFLRAN